MAGRPAVYPMPELFELELYGKCERAADRLSILQSRSPRNIQGPDSTDSFGVELRINTFDNLEIRHSAICADIETDNHAPLNLGFVGIGGIFDILAQGRHQRGHTARKLGHYVVGLPISVLIFDAAHTPLIGSLPVRRKTANFVSESGR